MNIRDFIRRLKTGKPRSANEAEAQQPEYRRELRELRLAIEVEQDFDKAIELAVPFLNSHDAELRRQAKRFIALSTFRKGDYVAAVEHFRELAADSTEAGDWFNVATSATLEGDIEFGEQAFEKALRCQVAANYSQQPSVPFMRQWYACALRDQKQFWRSLAQIEELRKIYEQLKITDDTFVYIRGVPCLSHTMDVAIDVFRGLGDSFDGVYWIESFQEKLDEEGRSYLDDIKKRLTGQTDTNSNMGSN
jgi:tetratricopeptide (TPR) repeat protein